MFGKAACLLGCVLLAELHCPSLLFVRCLAMVTDHMLLVRRWAIGKEFNLDLDPFLIIILTLSVIHAHFVSSGNAAHLTLDNSPANEQLCHCCA